MDTFNDNQPDGKAGDAQISAPDSQIDQQVDQSRRRFSGAALASGAVLISLGSRSAWGGGGSVAGCMSIMTLNSFHPDTGMFTSSPAGRPDHNIDLARRIHEIGGAPDFVGQAQSGEWRSCEHPYEANNICLVRGECPD